MEGRGRTPPVAAGPGRLSTQTPAARAAARARRSRPARRTLLRHGVAHRALRGQSIEIWGDGSVTRDYIHVQDVADAFAQALVYEGDRTCFNISAGVGASLNELVVMLGEVLGQSLDVRYLPGRPFDVKVNVLSNALAHQELGWVPRIGMREGLERTVEWMRQRLSTGHD